MDDVWISSGAFLTSSIDEVCRISWENGIKQIELSSGLSHHPEMRKVVQDMFEQGFRLLIHNYFPAPPDPFVLNIAARTTSSRQNLFSMVSSNLKLAKSIGANFYSLHAGYAIDLHAEELGHPVKQGNRARGEIIDRSSAYTAMVENTIAMNEIAESKECQLLIENNVISPSFLMKTSENPLLLTTSKEVKQFMSDVNSSNVRLLLDVAHLKVSAGTLGFDENQAFDEVAEFIGCFHLSDNDGRSDDNLPISKSSWFADRLKEFRNIPKVVEVYNISPDLMKEQADIVRELSV